MKRMLKPGMITVALAAARSRWLPAATAWTVPNFQNPTVSSITADPIAAIPLLATGVLRDDRGAADRLRPATSASSAARSYNYTPTEGRNTSGYLTSDVNNGTSFGGDVGRWCASQYFTVRDAFNTLNVVDASGAIFTDAQKSAMQGVMHTAGRAQRCCISSTPATSSASPVEVYRRSRRKLAPFVSRDSAFNYISGTLNRRRRSWPPAAPRSRSRCTSGYTGFTTPANVHEVQPRASPRACYAYRASLGASGCGAARARRAIRRC